MDFKEPLILLIVRQQQTFLAFRAFTILYVLLNNHTTSVKKKKKLIRCQDSILMPCKLWFLGYLNYNSLGGSFFETFFGEILRPMLFIKYICFVKNTFKNETHLLPHIQTEKMISQMSIQAQITLAYISLIITPIINNGKKSNGQYHQYCSSY